MSLKAGFDRFLTARPDRLHFAAHSHHPWPDVSYGAHVQAWEDAVDLADDKWEKVFGTIIPETQRLVAGNLGLRVPGDITFAPNTQDFLARIFSCLEPPVRVLTSDAEFHSFTRQSRRWEEAGLAIVDRVPAEPWGTFTERFIPEASAGAHDLIYLSHVFFDSGFVVPDLEEIVAAVPNTSTFVVIDGYHAFMAMPVDLSRIEDRVFYLAGGYKYAMAGEGACFLHTPPGYGPRPVDTGWFADFGQLESGVSELVPYASDASRFAGATFDPSGLYRLRAVLDWLDGEHVGPAEIREHVTRLQERFIGGAPDLGELIPPPASIRGNFLTFRSERAGPLYSLLHDRQVVADHRSDRLRLGFGIYHDDHDVSRLIEILRSLPSPSQV